MIALDTSALLAILGDEPEAAEFTTILTENDCVIGAPTRLEATIVTSARSERHALQLRQMLSLRNISCIDFSTAHAEIAQIAFERFGKGRGHPAQLNFGDCMSYAVARLANAPLLYKGDDFIHTDIIPAIRP